MCCLLMLGLCYRNLSIVVVFCCVEIYCVILLVVNCWVSVGLCCLLYWVLMWEWLWGLYFLLCCDLCGENWNVGVYWGWFLYLLVIFGCEVLLSVVYVWICFWEWVWCFVEVGFEMCGNFSIVLEIYLIYWGVCVVVKWFFCGLCWLVCWVFLYV